MHKIVIIRTYFEDATVGTLSIDGKEICNTLELPWKDNLRTISCIPEGTYTAHLEQHKKYGYCIRLPKVKDRSGILIHKGNELKHTMGCILVGMLPPIYEQPYYLKHSVLNMNIIFGKCTSGPIQITIAENLNLPPIKNINYE